MQLFQQHIILNMLLFDLVRIFLKNFLFILLKMPFLLLFRIRILTHF